MNNSIKEYLDKNYQLLFTNLSLLENAYTFTALYKILPVDIPVAIVTFCLSKREVEWLIEHRDNIIILAVEKAWKILMQRNIIPDFIVENKIDEYNKKLDDVVFIANIEKLSGKEVRSYKNLFLYFSEADLISYLCTEAHKKCLYPYMFNIMEPFNEENDSIHNAIKIAKYMQASNIIVLNGTDKSIKDDVNTLLKTNIKNTVSNLLPIMDENSKKEYREVIQLLYKEALKSVQVLDKQKYYYEKLNDVIQKNTAFQELLDKIVIAINTCNEFLNTNKLSFFVHQVILKFEEQNKIKKSQNKNDTIKLVVQDGIELNYELKIIYQFITEHIIVKQEENKKIINIKKTQKKILLVYGQSQYNVIQGFVNDIKINFQKLGYEVYLWDVTSGIKEYGYNIYQCTIGYEYIILLNGVGVEGIIKNKMSMPRFWYENENSKVATIFLDHPQIHIDRLKYIKDNVMVIYDDRYHCEYIKRYMPYIKHVRKIQLGGAKQEKKLFQSKRNKIVFFGTKHEMAMIKEQIEQFEFKELVWTVVNKLIIYPEYTVEEMIRIIGRKEHCLCALESIMLNTYLIMYVQIYMRAYFRKKVIMKLAQSGLPLELYGWNSDELKNYPNVIQKKSVSYEEMLKICQESRFVLNVQPWAKDAPQERAYNAMLGGTIVISDLCDTLENEYKDGESIILYDLKHIDLLPDKVRYYMEHDKKAEKIAECGYEITQQKHTYNNYVRNIIRELDTIN